MIEFLLLIIFVEAMTEILTSSVILEKPRILLSSMCPLFGELIHCGYCTSVWVSAIAVALTPLPAIFSVYWVNFMVTTFVVHRLSNILHELFSKWLNRRPLSFAVHKTEAIIMPAMETPDDPGTEKI